MSALQFNVVFEDAGPEVQTQGQDLDEARSMVRDAVELVVEERRARGEQIPAPGWALVERLDVAA